MRERTFSFINLCRASSGSTAMDARRNARAWPSRLAIASAAALLDGEHPTTDCIQIELPETDDNVPRTAFAEQSQLTFAEQYVGWRLSELLAALDQTTGQRQLWPPTSFHRASGRLRMRTGHWNDGCAGCATGDYWPIWADGERAKPTRCG